LAVSELGGLPGALAYHTSVVVDGQELFFGCTNGVQATRNLASHAKLPRKPLILDMGFTLCSGAQLALALSPHFERGSYDLIMKNCNSFSDCALHVLLRKRLDAKYCTLERMGRNCPSLVRLGSGGQYVPNPKAADFDVDAVIENNLSVAMRMPPIERALSDVTGSSLDRCVLERDATASAPIRKAVSAGAITGDVSAAPAFLDTLRNLADAFLAPCRSPSSTENQISEIDDVGLQVQDDEELVQQRYLQCREDVWADEMAQRGLLARSISVGGG
jgi:hypothetical protein